MGWRSSSLSSRTIDGDQLKVLLEGGDPLSIRPARPEPVETSGAENAAGEERTVAPATDPEPQAL